MAYTPAQIEALDSYTNAQIVKLLRYCIAELASNPESQVVGPANRSYTFRDMDQLQRMLTRFEQLAAADADATAVETTGCPVVTYQEPQV